MKIEYEIPSRANTSKASAPDAKNRPDCRGKPQVLETLRGRGARAATPWEPDSWRGRGARAANVGGLILPSRDRIQSFFPFAGFASFAVKIPVKLDRSRPILPNPANFIRPNSGESDRIRPNPSKMKRKSASICGICGQFLPPFAVKLGQGQSSPVKAHRGKHER